MAKTIDDGFNTLLGWLTPTGTETANAKSHRASIDACLKDKFGAKRFFRTGSFGNGTSISYHSDVDYFVNIPRERLKQDSNLTLNELKNVLDARFPKTGVHIDAPAVVVPFGDDPSETTEIVPGDFISRTHDRSTYEIPNGNGGWMTASPEAHKAYIDYVDGREGLHKKIKPLIRFIKSWKYCNEVPISSFYLEMYVGIYASKETSVVYDIDVWAMLSEMRSNNLPAIRDPMNISGDISACKNLSDRLITLKKLDEAITRAGHARNAASKNDIKSAYYWWDKFYDGFFPTY